MRPRPAGMIRLALAALLLAACEPGHGTAGDCHGLALGACRLTDGCVPDECAGCGCDVSYRGCLAPGEVPRQCPALGCPSGICCSSEMACAGSTGECTPPGSAFGCGACNVDPGDCATDAECTGTMICEPIACSCEGHLACTPGCTDDATCGEAQTCDVASSRCVARACSDATTCPSNFACTDHACARTTCTSDLECDGFCVSGSCFADRGECRLPVP